MTQDRLIIREQAYKDVIRSSKIVVTPWNQSCVHDTDVVRIRDDFSRLTNPETWTHMNVRDRKRLETICRCCLRFLPDWPLLVAQSMDACFSFPDATVRGLLWRCVLFSVRMEARLCHGVTCSIKEKLADRLSGEGEFKSVIVDGFLDTLESECIAVDVGLKPVVRTNRSDDHGSKTHLV